VELMPDRARHIYGLVVSVAFAVLGLFFALSRSESVVRIAGEGLRGVWIRGGLMLASACLLVLAALSTGRALRFLPVLVADARGLCAPGRGNEWRSWSSVVAIGPITVPTSVDRIVPEWMVRRLARVNYGSFTIEFDDGSRIKIADKPRGTSMGAFRGELERRWQEYRSTPGRGSDSPR
jgi:hypothetical protein